MATVKEIYDFLDRKAPFALQYDFDNSGLLVGRQGMEVGRLLVALDITRAVAREAREAGAQLIVSHHPVIFHPAKSITDRDPGGLLLLELCEGGIAAVCAHTNLDKVQGGVNDALALAVGLTQMEQLAPEGTDANGNPYGLGRVGMLARPCRLEDYAGRVKAALGANGVRYASGGRPVSRVAVVGGAGGDMLHQALQKGCDTLVTADAKYNAFLDAAALGLNLIDAGHYPTEQVVCPVLAGWLREGFPGVEVAVSRSHGREPLDYL
ncbi:GTP cyclohydrolase 1 type 2 [bioreactor metagenome]|uniref:GTP cyclohydrolase 1 type 2 n=1 Tax=bioreactor metagenome TaxID=1076179 RepID=A0A645AK45_9ZZZZ